MKRIVTILALLVLPVSHPTSATIRQAALTNDEVRGILQQRIDLAKQSVGIVIGLVDDKGTCVIAYGKTDQTGGKPVNGDSVFEIGSVSKIFTALILANMVERGEVKLNDPISRYLPSQVKAPTREGKEITLLDLSSQTSGLPRMPANFAPKDQNSPYADYSADQLYSFLSSYTLMGPTNRERRSNRSPTRKIRDQP